MPTPRWPLHPAPAEAEALSSWLNRLACTYRMDTSALLEHGLGQGRIQDRHLDENPPATLLTELARCSGVGRDRLGAMSLAGWIPWLFDSLEPDPEAYKTYVHQFSMLLPPGRRTIYSPPRWLPWIPEHGPRKACPDCLQSPEPAALLLFWQLPLMLSCPRHGRRIETYEGLPPDYLRWTSAISDPPATRDAVTLMDRRTWQALTTGSVDLPRRRVHAGIWFRLLRTLLDELSTAQGRYGRQLAEVRHVWEYCGHPFRAGMHAWRPFENLQWEKQKQLLEAAAATMKLIEAGTLSAFGTSVDLLLPEPASRIDDGTPPTRPSATAAKRTATASHRTEPAPGDVWEQAFAAMEEIVASAREDPAAAQQFYRFALYGCRNEDSVRRLRQTFAELQIPLDFLSQTKDPPPFA
ncbi:TniQ family protein [Pseudarthrobacter sp. S9]|uniref:TniQ family protein n=1 Tax=Pseudarthrobacter sp. S9 TaxID=3418421 RepID=UPI003D006FC4